MIIELVRISQKVTDHKGNEYIRTKDSTGIKWRCYKSTEKDLSTGLVEDHSSLEFDYGVATLRNDFV